MYIHVCVSPSTHSNRPLINRKLEDKTCGEGPSLEIIFEDDGHLLKLSQGVLNCIGRGFTIATEWASKFEPYRAFYDENEELDLEKLQEQEHGGWIMQGESMLIGIDI